MARVLRSVSLLALSRWRVICFESESNDAQWESNRPLVFVVKVKNGKEDASAAHSGF
jgi:hypothetical protein